MSDWNRYEGEVRVIDNNNSIMLTKENEVQSFLEILEKVPGCAVKMETSALLEHFGIGREIGGLPDSVFCNLYNGHYKNKLKWNPAQQKYLADAMRDNETRKKYLLELFNAYSIFYYEAEAFSGGETVWTSHLSGIDFLASGAVDFFGGGLEPDDWGYGMELMKLVAENFINDYDNLQQLHNLGWYDHPEHFNGLSEIFEVESKGLLLDNRNVLDGGKYTDNRSREYAAILKVPDINPNVRIVYAATERQDGSLPNFAPLLKKYRKTAKRVLDIPFFLNRLWYDGRQLRIWFFNGDNVNGYLVGLLEDSAAGLGFDREALCNSVLVEFSVPDKRNDMYLLLPGNHILPVMENGYPYSYGTRLLNKKGDVVKKTVRKID